MGWLGACALSMVLLVGACDAEPEAARSELGDTGDASDSGDVGPREVVAAATVVSTSPRSGPRDDLFPDLSGEDLVWTSVWLDTSVSGATSDTDCMACPYCVGCRADVLTRRLPAGPVVTVYAAPRVIGAARVGEGVVSFRDETGQLAVFDLGTRAVTRFSTGSGGTSWAGVPHDGAVWLHGYDPTRQNYMIRACRIGGTTCEGKLEANARDELSSNGTNLYELGRRQPFAAGERLVWSTFDDRSRVMSWSYAGTITTEAADSELMFRSPLLRGDGVVIAQAYERQGGCWSSDCVLGFFRLEGGEAEAILPEARPSRFVGPAMAGDRLVWIDRGEGNYVVMSATPAGEVRRLSGDGAEIGTTSNLAADGRRVAWAERRQGKWRIVAKTL